jgi:ParB-like nuclease family protein
LIEMKIDEIVVPNYRTIMGDDDLRDLNESVAEAGILIPILVDQNNVLIDGLRRYSCAKLQKLDKVPVTVATNYAEAVQAITEANKPNPLLRPLTPLRIWEFLQDTHDLMFAKRKEYGRAARNKPKVPKGQKTPGYEPVANPSRNALADALGLSSATYLQAVRSIFGRAATPGPYQKRAQYYRDLVMFDGYSAYGAYNRLRAEISSDMFGPSAQVQIDTLKGVGPVMEPILKSIKGLGLLKDEVPLDVAREALQRIRKLNTELFTASRMLRRYVTEKETNKNE